jgi:predicted nucleic acid-binding protein
MRVALDTNILVYFEGLNGAAPKKAAVDLIENLPEASTFLPVQALGELFRVLVRKARWPPAQAQTALVTWQNTFPLIETSPAVLLGAIDLAADHHLDIWDAVILSAAAATGCRLLLSEDMQEGFTWNGVTVVNPFAAKKNKLLAGALGE